MASQSPEAMESQSPEAMKSQSPEAKRRRVSSEISPKSADSIEEKPRRGRPRKQVRGQSTKGRKSQDQVTEGGAGLATEDNSSNALSLETTEVASEKGVSQKSADYSKEKPLRGRPQKHVKSSDSKDSNSVSQKPAHSSEEKCRRGRPPKHVKAPHSKGRKPQEGIVDEEESIEDDQPLCSLEKTADTVIEKGVTQISANPSEDKPRRGRPRKRAREQNRESREFCEDTIGIKDESIDDKSAGPLSLKSTDAINEKADFQKSTCSSEKKTRRGRPRKRVAIPASEGNVNHQKSTGSVDQSLEDESAGLVSTAVQSAKTTEAVAEKDVSQTSSKSFTNNRRRGQPPKQVQAQKRRGKKATKKELTTVEAVEEKKNYSLICLHCKFEASTLSALKFHLMKQHMMIWEPDKPEGVFDGSSAQCTRILKAVGYLSCSQCQKRINFTQYFKKHVEWCGREKEMSTCSICGKTYKAMWLREHERECLKSSLLPSTKSGKAKKVNPNSEPRTGKRKAASKARQSLLEITKAEVSDGTLHQKISEDQDYLEGDESEESSHSEEDSTSEPDSVSEKDTFKRVPFFTRKRSCTDDFRSTALEWTQTFYDSLTPCVHPVTVNVSEWRPISSGDEYGYLPYGKESVYFQLIRKTDQKPVVEGSIPLFESVHDGDDAFLYVGGPVYAADWCPMMSTDGSGDQFVAVGCSDDKIYNNTDIYEGRGVIQVWNCGPLHQKSCVNKPSLVLAICHQYGCTWDLKWCPSCAISECNSRLGVLAGAFSDGLVRLFDIPRPETMQELNTKCFTIPPAAVLSAPKGHPSSQCTSLDWMYVEGSHKLAAAFTDGCIGIWSATDCSSLVSSASVLYPIRFFKAHVQNVTSVAWCPSSAYILASTGMDFCVHLWDLRQPDKPHCTYDSKSVGQLKINELLSCASWSKIWSSLYVGCDDSLSSAPDTFMFCLRPDTQGLENVRLSIHYANILSTCVNDWLNCVLSCDYLGRVNWLSLSKHMEYFCSTKNVKKKADSIRSHTKKSSHNQKILFDTKLEARVDETCSKQTTDQTPDVSTYHSIARSHILVFEDKYIAAWKCKPPSKKKIAMEGKRFPLQALHKVVCNPNRNSSGWMLCAGQSGIVRLAYLQE